MNIEIVFVVDMAFMSRCLHEFSHFTETALTNPNPNSFQHVERESRAEYSPTLES